MHSNDVEIISLEQVTRIVPGEHICFGTKINKSQGTNFNKKKLLLNKMLHMLRNKIDSEQIMI